MDGCIYVDDFLLFEQAGEAIRSGAAPSTHRRSGAEGSRHEMDRITSPLV
jgi:hypothetical protein